MSGETEAEVSGWTVDTAMAHWGRRFADNNQRLDERFTAQETAVQFALTEREKAVNAALIAAKEAVNKAEVAAEKRFESVNEFRGQLSDQVSTFVPREVFDASVISLTDRVRGTVTRGEMIGAVVVVGVVSGILGHFIN